MLTRFAEQSRNPRLTPIVGRAGAPVRVLVTGRSGVGRATVSAALTGVGLPATTDGDYADVSVLVIAESLKPEDRLQAARSGLIIMNKADLTGFGADGPLVLAQRRAAAVHASTSTPTVPMIGLLASAELDDELMTALQTLVHAPADLTSTDAFVESEHPLPRPVRRRLLDTLDRFGIAHAVLAIEDGADVVGVRTLLCRVSQIEEVAAHVHALTAPVRYRRVRAALAELHSLATRSRDSELAGFLAADETVLAVMGAAVEVVEADGMFVDRADNRSAHLRRAVHWRRYANGPVVALHRNCAADICRGSLRLLGRCR